MSDPTAAEAVDSVIEPWTPEQVGILAAAEALAGVANRRRRWRRKVSPLEFVSTARRVVVAQRAAGLTFGRDQ